MGRVDQDAYHFNMVVHMTAGPHGCGRDMYIFMRPEMVNGKVCFVLVLLLSSVAICSCYTACALMLHGLCIHEQRGLDSSPLEHSGHINRKWMNRDMLMYAHVCVQYVPIKE